MTKRIILSISLVLLVLTGCKNTTTTTVVNEQEFNLTYKDENDNTIKTVSFKPSEGIEVEKIIVDNIEYEGFFKNGNTDDFVFIGERIANGSDVVLKTKWIKSSYYEIPASLRVNTDETYFRNHKIYKNKYNNEYYDRDARQSWKLNIHNR